MVNMVEVNGARYREEDAKRLGLIASGKVITPNSVQVPRTTGSPEGAAGHTAPISTGSANANPGGTPPGDENPDGRPSKGAKTEEWVEYAKAQGKTDEELKDLKRGEIIELFPAE